MTLKRYISKKLFGISIPQEYVCLGLENFNHPFKEFVTGRASSFSLKIVNCLFLGYKPLLIGLWYHSNSDQARWLMQQERVCISLVKENFRLNKNWRGFPTDADAVAKLILKKIHVKELGNILLFIFTGEYGEHKFLSSFHQFTNGIRETLRIQKPENYLPGNLYDQVRIGYSKPRIISMITVCDSSGRMNMFPTDLHGPAGTHYYAGSLRHGGKANQQVEQFERVVISRVSADWYNTAYSFGKNHVMDVKPQTEFPLATIRSHLFGIPLPESVVHYHELRRLDSFDVGIHRVHFYETLHEEQVSEKVSLAHIHLYYAQWRMNHNLPAQLLLRK